MAALVSNSELENIRRALAALPDRSDATPEQIAERSRAKELHKQRLAALAAANAAVAAALEAAVRSFTGTAAEPASFDALHELLELQAYHLAYWRVAADDINYRRFFDVNDLAALRVDNEAVFEVTHRLRAAADRRQAGSTACASITSTACTIRPATCVGCSGDQAGPRPYRERARSTWWSRRSPPRSSTCRRDWPVHGETGYHFANVVNRMLIDSATRTRMDRVYRGTTGESHEWRDVAYECQQLVLRRSLASELNVATNQLARIARSDRNTRDFTFGNAARTRSPR